MITMSSYVDIPHTINSSGWNIDMPLVHTNTKKKMMSNWGVDKVTNQRKILQTETVQEEVSEMTIALGK
jgi:hypothetical protein